jgi:transcriptional regulator of acetoin/glycerol metabolism
MSVSRSRINAAAGRTRRSWATPRRTGAILARRSERVALWSEFRPPMYPKRGAPDFTVESAVKRHVAFVIAETCGDLLQTSKLLGIDPATLYRWRKVWGLP